MDKQIYEQQEQYANWLSNERWDYFFTGTFDRWDRSPNSARRAAERFFRGFHTRDLIVLFIESGRLYGRVHLHGLLRFYPDKRPTATTVWQRWDKAFGFAKVETIRSNEAVSKYCCKYVTKHMKDETFIVL